MIRALSSFLGWFGISAGPMSNYKGKQITTPGAVLVDGTTSYSPDQAMQIAAVWSAVDRRAKLVASLPFFAYNDIGNGRRELARSTRLYALLHDSPNSRMTPYQFWVAMMMNHDLRGNAYARIERAQDGEAIALWPMPADQVDPAVLEDGAMVYAYRIGDDVAVLSEENVLHLKDLGNGTVGLSRLEYMRGTTTESAKAQEQAQRLFGASGKPTGLLMVDNVLRPDQRATIRQGFSEMASGSTSRLFVLEANMKYQQLSMTPEDQQLMESRQFSIEEIARWFDVPPVLIHHSNVTTWGSGVEQILDGFHKFTIRPMLVSIEQVVRKRVMTAKQRASMTAEFNLDALLRGNAKDRAEIAAQKAQNGLATRNELRQLENDPPLEGGDVLTVQSNLLPISMLGKVPTNGGQSASSKIAQSQ